MQRFIGTNVAPFLGVRWRFLFGVFFGSFFACSAFGVASKPCPIFLTDLVFALHDHPPQANNWPLQLGQVIGRSKSFGGRDANVSLVSERERSHGPSYVLRVHDGLPLVGASPEARAKHLAAFKRESETLARFQHPNIVSLLSASPPEAETPWQVLEYLRRGTWSTLIEAESKKQKRGQPREISMSYLIVTISAAMDVLSALDAIHQKGIIHRDLKPANIGFAANGSAKLMDFTAAWYPEDGVPNYILGTQGYMAPEAWDYQKPTPAYDLYALGTSLGEALADFSNKWIGPKFGNYDYAWRARVFEGRMAQLRTVRVRNSQNELIPLPEALLNILSDALQPAPLRRIQSAAVMSDRLAAICFSCLRVNGRQQPISHRRSVPSRPR